MTTLTTLNDVRTALIAQGYPAEQVDAMLNLAGRMMFEGNLASKDDLNALRNELGQFKVEVAERFAQLRVEMHQGIEGLRTEMHGEIGKLRTEMHEEINKLRTEMHEEIGKLRTEMHEEIGKLRTEMHEEIGKLRTEMNEKFAEQRADSDARERRIIKWVAGAVIGGIAVNVAVLGIGITIVALLVR